MGCNNNARGGKISVKYSVIFFLWYRVASVNPVRDETGVKDGDRHGNGKRASVGWEISQTTGGIGRLAPALKVDSGYPRIFTSDPSGAAFPF